MKKIVFLHGSGSDKNAYKDLMQLITNYTNIEVVSFNAPFHHPSKLTKYTWFNKFEEKKRRDAVIEEYEYSLKYIKDQLKKLNFDIHDILLIGHSQGGGMAVHVGLQMELAGVISISGDLPYNISYKKITKTPIYWLEGAKDTYIDDSRKKSYKLILNNNNFHFLTLPHSTHTEFSDDFLEIIHNKKIKF